MPFDTQYSDLKIKHGGTPPASQTIDSPALFPVFTYDSGFKRLLDIALVLISLPIVLPLIALMAVFVSLDGHAPFYTQLRVGRNGRTFRIIKMRTMVHNADALLKAHLARHPSLKTEWDSTQKLKNDIRITRIGRILRKTSMDELPQLINVLTGSMSLVGPRPMMVCQQELYPGKSYYRLRPGITGFWQISDRNDCDFRDRATHDAAYERSMSLATDFKVLCATVAVVLRGTGY